MTNSPERTSPSADFAIPADGTTLRPRRTRLPPALALLRPHQWVKNAFVAAPLFFTPGALSLGNILLIVAGVLSFCLIASAVYVLNDFVDRHADRMHPVKRSRPIASGAVSPAMAAVLLAGALTAGMALAFGLDLAFGVLAAVYFVINMAYSFGLKHISIVDVMCITLGFILRVMAGAALIGVEPSVWIIACTGLVALFLALAKRRDDLVRSLGGQHRKSLDGYTKPFLDTAIAVVLGALLVNYMMYTTDASVAGSVGSERLYLTVPFVIAGILRYLQIMLVEERSGAPTTIMLTDRFMIVSVGLWALSFAGLVYL
ncbi:MAG TPA: decaprenyl-phosphate phosphoribosyltransferase [Alphaproteobacteria bacterium]|nr:decaprenyl-phosphate phosphoribosyltransferase [Alphaproteobacteria bacterium]